MLHEAFGRDELHLAGSNVLVGDETAYAAVMIEMRMAVDRRDDRSFTELPVSYTHLTLPTIYSV